MHTEATLLVDGNGLTDLGEFSFVAASELRNQGHGTLIDEVFYRQGI